jgi:hypothetical protein
MEAKYPIRGSGDVDIATISAPSALLSGGALNLLGVSSVVSLAADVSNAEAVANTITSVTGLSFAVEANGIYQFEFNIFYTAAATATGSRWCVSGPTLTVLSMTSEYALTGTTTTRNANVVGYDLPATSNATSGATAGNYAYMAGFVQCSAAGTFTARFASEVSASAIVAKAGSYVTYRKIA